MGTSRRIDLRQKGTRLVVALLTGVMLQTCCIVCTVAAYVPRIQWLR